MNRKKVGIIVVAVLLVLAVAAALIWYFFLRSTTSSSTSQKTTTSTSAHVAYVCTEEQIQTASSSIEPYNADTLRTVVASVQNTSGYENDPNCEYILARYYIVTGQADAAAKAVNQIQVLQTAGGQYSTSFNPPAVNVSDLRTSVQTLRDSQSSTTTTVSSDELNSIDKATGR